MSAVVVKTTLSDALRAACADVGVVFKDVPADGRFHPTDLDGDHHGHADGRIKLFSDGAGGIVWNWKGESQVFFVDHGGLLTEAERQDRDRRRNAAKREAEEEDKRRRSEAQRKATEVWTAATAASDDHPYLVRKGITAHGVRVHELALVIPLYNNDILSSLQFIKPDGDKRFLTDGKVAGCYFLIGSIHNAMAMCIAEGFATAATINKATGHPVAVAFHAGNLEPVAKASREKYPSLPLIVCADDDAFTEGNPGISKAKAAARSASALLAIPDFGADRPPDSTDFNDMAKHCGVEAVKSVITKSLWPEPLPLAATLEAVPYPIDALPEAVRAAVEEVLGFTKAPVPLVASSALSALSVAIQAHVDVARADRLVGPTSLYLLSIADSGERKSKCDDFFSSAIRNYDKEQAELAKPELQRYAAEYSAWAAERDGVLAAIKQAAKSGKAVDDLKKRLASLEQKQPKPPKVPNLMRGDDTPENLAWVLARQWPSAGVITAEAGLVLGAHGMGSDSILRNLGLLNILWDGGVLKVGRKTSDCFEVSGARLTMGLQVQELTLRSFFDKSKGLARGTGYLARFLLSWPESTQGFRPFTNPPELWPALTKFNSRIAEILRMPVKIDDAGALCLSQVSLSQEAKVAWIDFHDAIEVNLRIGGELFDVRDVASKIADNAVRLAALFHVFQHGPGGAIGLESFEGASRIAAWHLNESRRFFGGLALPDELTNAAKLNDWLVKYCREKKTPVVPRREVQHSGPYSLRHGPALDAALIELINICRVRVVSEDGRKDIIVNPAVIERGTS